MVATQKILLPLAWVLVHTSVAAQRLFYPFTPANVSSARYGQTFSNPLVAALNPATAPYINGVEAGLFAQKKYQTDINVLMLSAGFSFDNNGVGILLQQFGNGLYSERTAGLSYGKRVGRLNIGVSIQHINVNLHGHGNAAFLRTAVSSLVEITDNVTSSLSIFNPNFFISPKSDNLRLASGYSLGFGWQVSPVVYTGIETLKQEGMPLAITFNLQYQFAEELSAAISWSTDTNQPNVCVGWRVQRINFEAGCSYHAALGVSPSVSILYKK